MSPRLFNTLLIISSIVLYAYVIKPLYYTGVEGIFWTPESSVQSLRDLNDKYQKTIDGVDGIIRDANKLKGQYETFDEESKNKMMIMVPPSVNEIKLLSELTNIANNAGFAVEDVSVKDKNGEYSIALTFRSTYLQFKQFVDLYEKNMRLLTIKSVSFSPSKDEEALVKFDIEFSTYYLK